MKSPFTSVYGLARTIIALGTMSALLFSPADSLFRPAARGVIDSDGLIGLARYGLFYLLRSNIEEARWIAIGTLAVVASGWRPRITGVLHWWVSASFFSAMVTQDGGDQCASTLTMLLVPLTLCDARTWHWAPPPPVRDVSGEVLRRIGQSSLFAARLQVAVIYLNAAVGKAAAKEWADGTAIYYWLLDTRIGIPTSAHDWVLAAMAPLWVAPLLTWAPVVLEYCLVLGIAMAPDNPARRYLFRLGLAFHVGNTLFFGLFSFMMVMFGALLLLLRPPAAELALPRWIRDSWSKLRIQHALGQRGLAFSGRVVDVRRSAEGSFQPTSTRYSSRRCDSLSGPA